MTEKDTFQSRFDRYNLMMTVEAGDDPVHPDQAYKIAHNLLRKCLVEIDRLRQGLWDIAGIAGADLDGDQTPKALVSDIVAFAKDAVSELRDDYYAEAGRD